MTGPEFQIRFVWVPPTCGGHKGPPQMGMPTTLRWQQYVEESCERVFDAEFIELDFNEDSNFARARHRRGGMARAWLSARRSAPSRSSLPVRLDKESVTGHMSADPSLRAKIFHEEIFYRLAGFRS